MAFSNRIKISYFLIIFVLGLAGNQLIQGQDFNFAPFPTGFRDVKTSSGRNAILVTDTKSTSEKIAGIIDLITGEHEFQSGFMTDWVITKIEKNKSPTIKDLNNAIKSKTIFFVEKQRLYGNRISPESKVPMLIKTNVADAKVTDAEATLYHLSYKALRRAKALKPIISAVNQIESFKGGWKSLRDSDKKWVGEKVDKYYSLVSQIGRANVDSLKLLKLSNDAVELKFDSEYSKRIFSNWLKKVSELVEKTVKDEQRVEEAITDWDDARVGRSPGEKLSKLIDELLNEK